MTCLLLANSDLLAKALSMPTIVFIFVLLIVLGGQITNTIQRVSVERQREQTRREIAAYVAEGTIPADKAVEMLNAGTSKKRKKCDPLTGV